VAAGALPPGVSLADGELVGAPSAVGTFDATLAVRQGAREATRRFRFVVRGENLAPAARRVLASVPKTSVPKRDAMWLTLALSTYADDVAVIRDGRREGKGQTFYSIGDSDAPRKDYYGYEWASPQTIALLSFHSGAVEENGGWFTSLDVEYRGADGAWIAVRDLAVDPPLTEGEQPFNKPHFVERRLSFRPVTTTAIRMIGDAGHTRHWRSRETPFTSITELGVFGPVPGLPGGD
jgi:hypothetical protein